MQLSIHVPIHIHIDVVFSKIVEYLLEKKANPNSRANRGQAVIHEAAAAGHLRVLQVLVRHDPKSVKLHDAKREVTVS